MDEIEFVPEDDIDVQFIPEGTEEEIKIFLELIQE
jgi:hypothetical protein|tara:strand:+ start:508 stop:612 length:105 start_codon:yes stop_codon:yes gene_type:complete